MEYTVISRSDTETKALGERLAQALPADVFIALDGGLGAGKTVFVKGFAAGLGIKANILSPTFTLLREYEGKSKLHHFDVYRIEEEDELLEVGFDEIAGSGGAVIVEWAAKVPGLLPEKRVSVDIKGAEEENTRVIQIHGASEYESAVRSALC